MRLLKEVEPNNIAVRRLKCYNIEMEMTNLPGILKREGKDRKKKQISKGVSFDGTCHINHARLLTGMRANK